MKKIAIIILALIVGLCLAHGAFAGEKPAKRKYMVILVGVDSGNVEGVYATAKLGSPDPDKSGVILLKCKEATPHEKKPGIPAQITGVLGESTILTKFAASSPGCRYIFYNGYLLLS